MKHIVVFLILGGCVFFIACEQNIPLEIEEYEQQLVIHSILEAGEEAEVYLTRSQSILGTVDFDGSQFVSDASVRIIHNGDTHELVYIEEEQVSNSLQNSLFGQFFGEDFGEDFTSDTILVRYFKSDFEIAEGEAYELEIDWQGRKYQASTEVPYPVPISAVYDTFEVYSFFDFTDTIDYVAIEFIDEAETDNFYYYDVELSYDLSLFGEESIEIKDDFVGTTLVDDLGSDGGEMFLRYFTPYFPIELEEGEKDTISMSIRLRNTNKITYDYLSSSFDQQWSSGDPSSEPIRIESNIEGGGFGVFGAYAPSESYDVYLIFEGE